MADLRLCALPGDEKFGAFLVACLSVMLLNGRVCANDFAIKVFEYGNAFDTDG